MLQKLKKQQQQQQQQHYLPSSPISLVHILILLSLAIKMWCPIYSPPLPATYSY
jgi:hypothetical protein